MAVASNTAVGAAHEARRAAGCRGGAAAGYQGGAAAVGMRTRRGPNSALMALRACRRVTTTQRRCANERARREEREADRWDPAAAIF
jgi:hypothetical protein